MVEADRTARIVAALGGRGPLDLSTYPDRVCAVSIEFFGVTGAGLTLMGGAGQDATWSSDAVVLKIEAAQLGLGEGPGLDAYANGTPILEPDLAGAPTRWPLFSPAALDLGAQALFALPLQVGVIGVGVLLLYRSRPGYLSDDELADALILADVATGDILDFQARGGLPWNEIDAGDRRAKVHQATGMLSVQVGSSMADALARLRAHAFSTGSTIDDVAEAVVSRRLRLE